MTGSKEVPPGVKKIFPQKLTLSSESFQAVVTVCMMFPTGT